MKRDQDDETIERLHYQKEGNDKVATASDSVQ